ncbi:MAG TPA: hypothetical protein VFK05_32030 [Polyangiaceae bacterium]|nr:hypothetical protein [Polyangiaceae bacterium]
MSHERFRPALLSSLLALASCAPSMPPRWAEGGAPLLIAPAHWQRGDDDPVEIQADGRVLEGGKLRFTIDRVGRVTNEDYDAVAVLLPDGHVVGTDDRALGYVGLSNASPPFSGQAWVSLLPDGRVVFFHPDGDRGALGQWTGCNGPSRRTCTLVTQMFLVQNLRMAPTYGPTFGVGVGVGVGF